MDLRSQANREMIEELIRSRKHGLTLKEKIERHLEKSKRKGLVSLITDSFFDEVEEAGRLLYLRRTNLQRDGGRTLNVEDEIEVEAAQQRERIQEEESKDRTYTEYCEEFIPHIEGQAKNEREAAESVDEEALAAEAAKSQKKTTSKS